MIILNKQRNHIKENRKILNYNIWNFIKLFKTALMIASQNGHTERVKILVAKEGININAKDKVYFNNFIFQNNI